MNQASSVDLCVNQRGRKAKPTRQDIDTVNDLVNKQLDLSIREINERLHLNVCEGIVCKACYKDWLPSTKEKHSCLRTGMPFDKDKTYLLEKHANSSD